MIDEGVIIYVLQHESRLYETKPFRPVSTVSSTKLIGSIVLLYILNSTQIHFDNATLHTETWQEFRKSRFFVICFIIYIQSYKSYFSTSDVCANKKRHKIEWKKKKNTERAFYLKRINFLSKVIQTKTIRLYIYEY